VRGPPSFGEKETSPTSVGKYHYPPLYWFYIFSIDEFSISLFACLDLHVFNV